MSAPRKPDYRLGCLNKSTEQRGQIGAAWLNEDGTIRVVLNPLTTIPSDPDLVLTLFPTDRRLSEEIGQSETEQEKN